MQQRQILFTGQRQLEIRDRELPPVGPDQVLVRTEVSLMSTGTENICFNRLFAPGTHFDKWVKYPFEPGYSTIGIAEEVGSSVSGIKVGQRIAHRKGHSDCHIINEGDCIVVPPTIAPEDAVWFALAHITFNGARNVGFHLGDKVAVIGAGPIGQMTLRWAVAAGAEVTLALDMMSHRLDVAKKGGATYTLDIPASDAKEAIAELMGGSPDVVVDATGHAAVFPAALGLVKTQGRVLLIGDTGSPAEQHLTPDLVTRGLTVVGAHDHSVFPDRTKSRIAELFFRLVQSGRFSLDGMNTHWFRPNDALAAYSLANQARADTMGILFRW